LEIPPEERKLRETYNGGASSGNQSMEPMKKDSTPWYQRLAAAVASRLCTEIVITALKAAFIELVNSLDLG
jgi:hypothetical protein